MAHVTVIIPSQNNESTIGATIQSALDQTYADVAVIVVDDGSSDNTPAIVRQYAASNPNRVLLIEDAEPGFSKARDAGIERAQGEWIVNLDAEDTLYPEAVAAWLDYTSQYPEHSVIYSGWNDVNADGTIEENLPHTWTDDPLEGSIMATLIRSFDGIMQPALINRANIITCGGYSYKTVDNAGDSGWIHLFGYFRMLARGFTFGYVPQVLLNTRQKARWAAADPELLKQQRIAVYEWLFRYNQPPAHWIYTPGTTPTFAVTHVDTVNEIRRAQLKDAFAAIRTLNGQLQGILGEIEKARIYQTGLETTLQQLQQVQNGGTDQQVQMLLTEIEKARSYQAWQDQTIGTLRQQVFDLEKGLNDANQRIQRDASRPQQISALIDHIETLEAELSAYRATTTPDAEARQRELYDKWQEAQRELDEIYASPAFRLLGRRTPRKETKS